MAPHRSGSFDPRETQALLREDPTARLIAAFLTAPDPLSAADLADGRDRRTVEDRVARLLAAGIVEPATPGTYRLTDEACSFIEDLADPPEALTDAVVAPPDPEDDEAAGAIVVSGTDEDTPALPGLRDALVDALAHRHRRPAIDEFLRQHGLEQFATVLYYAYRVEQGELGEDEATAELPVDQALFDTARSLVEDAA